MTPIASIAGRQPYSEISQLASGDIVSGAAPMPAETSETASARFVVNQPITLAIIGAKKALAERPTNIPYVTWNASSEVARLASTSARPRSTAPITTTIRVPKRSLAQPQPKAPSPITTKLRLIALDTAARDHPVSRVRGSRNTASENIAPTATQPIRPPSATTTHPYFESIPAPCRCPVTPWSNGADRNRQLPVEMAVPRSTTG